MDSEQYTKIVNRVARMFHYNPDFLHRFIEHNKTKDLVDCIASNDVVGVVACVAAFGAGLQDAKIIALQQMQKLISLVEECDGTIKDLDHAS